MVGRTIKIVLLLLLVSCGNYKLFPKFSEGDCIKNKNLTYEIVRVYNYHYIMWYPTEIVRKRIQDIDKIFKKVSCEE